MPASLPLVVVNTMVLSGLWYSSKLATTPPFWKWSTRMAYNKHKNKIDPVEMSSHVHVCQQWNVRGGVRVRFWIREQRKIKRRYQRHSQYIVCKLHDCSLWVHSLNCNKNSLWTWLITTNLMCDVGWNEAPIGHQVHHNRIPHVPVDT